MFHRSFLDNEAEHKKIMEQNAGAGIQRTQVTEVGYRSRPLLGDALEPKEGKIPQGMDLIIQVSGKPEEQWGDAWMSPILFMIKSQKL